MPTPPPQRPFVLVGERVEPVRLDDVDLYLPYADGRRPVVVLVHGGPIQPDTPPPSSWPVFRGYGGELARRGVVAALVRMPFDSVEALPDCAEVLRRAVRHVRAHDEVDGDRVAMWFFSNGGTLMGEWLDDRPRWLRAVAATYPRLRMTLPGVTALTAAADVVGTAVDLPVLVTRVEHEREEVAATVAEFVRAATDTAVEIVDVPGAYHGFDKDDPTSAAVAAVDTALSWVVDRLTVETAMPYQRLAAYAVLRRGDELLLTRISARGAHAGSWTLPGGGVEHGEQVRAGLIREVQEETGLDVQIGRLRDVHTVHFTGRGPSGRLEDYHGVHLIFDAELTTQTEPRVVETDGSTDAVAWVPIGDIDSGQVLVVDVVRHALR